MSGEKNLFDFRITVENDGSKAAADDGIRLLGSQVAFPSAFGKACAEVNRGRKNFVMADGMQLACDPFEHPDSRVIREWLDKSSKDPEELHVIAYLSLGVRSEWKMLPQRTRSQHRELFKGIAALCRELKDALSSTDDPYRRGGGYGLSHASVRDLLTDDEQATFHKALDTGPYKLDDWEMGSTFPRMEELLDRVASAAERLEQQGPIHSQPNKRGAERGYFVRRMCELFIQRYGVLPYEVIAALTTIALGEATDRELVAKLMW